MLEFDFHDDYVYIITPAQTPSQKTPRITKKTLKKSKSCPDLSKLSNSNINSPQDYFHFPCHILHSIDSFFYTDTISGEISANYSAILSRDNSPYMTPPLSPSSPYNSPNYRVIRIKQNLLQRLGVTDAIDKEDMKLNTYHNNESTNSRLADANKINIQSTDSKLADADIINSKLMNNKLVDVNFTKNKNPFSTCGSFFSIYKNNIFEKNNLLDKLDNFNLYPVDISNLKLAFGCQSRVGKDTAGEWFKSKYPQIRIEKFARKLYNITNNIQEQLGFDVQKDPTLLQNVATLLRSHYTTDVFVNSVNIEPPVIFTDLRFKNEADFLKKNGFILVRVIRNNRVIDRDINHPSENEGLEINYDVVLTNNSTLNEFFAKLANLDRKLIK